METSDGGKQQLPYLDLFLLFAMDLSKFSDPKEAHIIFFLIFYFN